MKVRYLFAAAVLVLSALILAFPTGSEDVSGEPATYEDLDEQTRVLIGSTYCDDMPLTEGGTDPSAMVKVRSDAAGNNYIGYYDGSLYLVLDAPAWVDGQESSLPTFYMVFQETDYEIRAVNLEANPSVTVLKLDGDNQGLTVEPVAGGVYVDSSSPSIYRNYCTLTSGEWLIYDASLEKYVGSAEIKGHTAVVDQPAGLKMTNGVFRMDFTGGAITVSQTQEEVTYTMVMQPLIDGTPSLSTDYSLSFGNTAGYPMQTGHTDTDGRYSLQVNYSTDTTGENYSVQYDSVAAYPQNIFFNAAKHGEVYLGSSANHDAALSFTNSENAPTLVYKNSENTYYRYNGVAGYEGKIIVALAPRSETYEELSLIGGNVELTGGTKMRVSQAVIGAGSETIELDVNDVDVSVKVTAGESFTLDGCTYTAVGEGTVSYAPFNSTQEDTNLHGVMLDTDQKVILGNGATAFYSANGDAGEITRAIRNETSLQSTEKTVTADRSTDPLTVSTSVTGVFLGSYVLSAAPSLDTPVLCSVTGVPFAATVNNNSGAFDVSSGAKGDVTVVEAGDQLNLSEGTIFLAAAKSVFTGAYSSYVMESGQGSMTSDDTSSVTIRRPDDSTLTLTGISQITLGETCTFLFQDGSISIGTVAYGAVEESQFTLDSSNVLRMTYGRVTLSQNVSVTLPGTGYDMMFLASSESGGEIQYSTSPTYSVSIYSGVFSVSLSSGNISSGISLMAAGSGFAYNGSTVTYADGQADLNIYSGFVRLTGSSQSVSFDGGILTATRIYTSVGGLATIMSGSGSADIPSLTSGTVLTSADILVNDITISPTGDATVASSGTVTLGGSKAVTASVTILPPVGDPVTQTLSFTNNSDSTNLVLSFAADTDLTATLVSGSVKIADGVPVTANSIQYTAAEDDTVLTLDGSTVTIDSGSVSTSAHTMNGLYMEGVDGDTFTVSSTGYVGKSTSFRLYFDHDDTKQYDFSSDASFTVTDDGEPVIVQNSVTLPEGGSFCFNTSNGVCLVTAVTGSGMAVNGTDADTITGIEENEAVQVTGDGVSFSVTGADEDNAASVNVNQDRTITISAGTSKEAIIEMDDMTLYAGSTTFTGSGTLDVLSTASNVISTYTSGAFAVSGTLTIAGFNVSGDYSVSGSDITVPASGTVTITPADGGDSAVYENASSADEMVFSNSTGVFRISSGAYKLHAGGTVTIGGYDVTFVSDDVNAFAAVGSGSITASDGQKFKFAATDSADEYTFTSAADGTVFSISTGIEVTAGAVAIGGENSEQVTIRTSAGTPWYVSTTGAVISVGSNWGELVSGSAAVGAGSRLVVSGTDYLAGDGGAVITLSGTEAVLTGGNLVLEEGYHIKVSEVTVTNSSRPDITLSSDMTAVLVRDSVISTEYGSQTYTYTAASDVTVGIAADGMISVIGGDITLNQGESVTVGDVTITATVDNTVLSVDDGIATLNAGAVTISASGTIVVSDISVTGPVSASVTDTPTVTLAGGGTVTFASKTETSYTNASATEDLVFVLSEGRFIPQSGNYRVYFGDSVTINGVTVSVGGQTGDSIVVEAGSNTVTLSDGKTVIFSVDTDITYTAASDGTSFAVNSLNNLPLVSGSVTLSDTEYVLIGSTTYTAASDQTVISSVSNAGVLTAGSVSFPAGSSVTVGSTAYTAVSREATLSADGGKATLVSGMVSIPDGASVTVLGVEFTAFDGSGTLSAVESSDGDYVDLYQGSLSIVSAASLTVYLSGTDSLLKVGDSTFAHSDSTFGLSISGTAVTLISTEPWVAFNGTITIGGVTYQSDGEALICYNGTFCELGSGTVSFAGSSADPVTLRMETYSVSAESEVKIGLVESQGAKTPVLYSGSVTALSNLSITVDGTSFDIDSGVIVTSTQTFTIPEQKSMSFTVSASEMTIANNGLGELTYAYPYSMLSIPSGCESQLTIGSASAVTYVVAAVSSATMTVGPDVQELLSGSILLSAGQTVKIGSGTYTMDVDSTVGIESGTAVLLDGGVSFQDSVSLKAGGTLFTAGSNGASITYSGPSAPNLSEGSVTVAGTFEIAIETLSFFVEGSGTYTMAVDPTDKSVKLTTSGDGTGGTMVKIISDQNYMILQEVSSAVISVRDVAGTTSSLPSAKLLDGSVVLGENASVTVPAHSYGTTYILFSDTTPGAVRVEHQTDNSPIVTLRSGSVSLDDGVDPTYTNVGNGEASFVALGSGELSLKEGTITVPVGSTVYVGDKMITAVGGEVSVNSSGDVTLGAGAEVEIFDQFGSVYTLINNSSEPMTQNVDVYVADHIFESFNTMKDDCIYRVQEMYRPGQSQKVRALIDSTLERLRATVYDSKISYEENIRNLDHMVMSLEVQISELFDPEQAFAEHKESVIMELESLHVGETSLSEQHIIDNAIVSISTMQYSDMTYDDDMATMNSVLAEVEKKLSVYRSSGSAAFIVFREILKDYINTEPEDGFEAITSLKAQYSATLDEIQYLNNLSSAGNLERLNELMDAFDGAVYSIHTTEYQKAKNAVLAEMNGLYQSYPSPAAKSLIDSAVSKVNLRSYDAQKLYADNVNILTDLLANLKTNLSSTLLGNIETFNAYCDAFLKRYNDAITSYTQAREDTSNPEEQDLIDNILGWIQDAKDQVDPTVEGHITYDTTKSLNDNINAVFTIAKDLEDQINNAINAQITDELDRVYDAALAHIALNDREGVPTKLRDYIATTRTDLETEYESEHTAMDKGLAINAIMTTYNTEMAVLIEQAEFYLNVDAGIKFLQDRYATSYPAVVSLMNTDIALLKALNYDTSKEMSQNLSELQDTINGYSVALATLRKDTTQGDFENYREFMAWTVTKLIGDTPSQAERDLADQYAASIRAVEFNGKSIESNRYAVDKLYSEFEDKYYALIADQRKGDFDTLRNTLRSDIDAALLDGDGDSVRVAADRGKAWIGEFVYDRSAEYSTNEYNVTCIREATLLAMEYERATDAATKAAKVTQANTTILNIPGLIATINGESLLDDSQKVRSIIDSALTAASSVAYDFSKSPRDNLAATESMMSQFARDLYEQRLMDNSVAVGGIRADGKTIDGKTAEYPSGSAEIWGIVANASGIGDDASATISRVSPTLDPAAGTTFPASGSVANVLSNGKVLGAFDVTLYDGGERVTSFTGMYCIKILLPEDMRGFDSVQVAYVDEFGDIQVYDARVEGNYLVFETSHFSTFNVYGNIIIHKHYDIYLYAVLIVLAVLIMLYLIRVVRYDANGGHGKTSATVFFCDGEGSLPENGFAREGYVFGGWSRMADGSEPIAADAELSALGKIHFLKLYAVWTKEEVQQ